MDNTITVDPLIVSVIVGAVIPVITGVVTKLNSTTGVKAITAAVLASAGGVLTQLFVDNPDNSFVLKEAVVLAALVFVTNLGTYLGIYKPVGKTDQVPLQNITAPYGLG